MKIGSNIASLYARRQLDKTSKELSKVYERLSSGMRINRASDDAAGLAIADSLRSDSRIFRQAVRNLNDGISLLNIADSAIESLSGITNRLIELSEQSANGTYSKIQREALDKEAQALASEYFRIAQSTSYNDLNLFNGEIQSLQLQAGAGQNTTLNISLGGALGNGTFSSGLTLNTTTLLDSASGDINGDGILDFVSVNGTGTIIMTGSGNGTFSLTGTISGMPGSGSYNLQDMNNDGNLDAVSFDNANNKILVALGKGDGSFGQVISSVAKYVVTEIKTGDINGDGIQDILAASNISGNLEILIGRGDGSFNSTATYFNAGTGEIALGDFNGDGKLDFTTGQVGLIAYFGNGNGTFINQPFIEAVSNFRGVSTADLNGDGLTDIIASNISQNRIEVYLANTGGTFTSAMSYSASTPREAVTGDLNGDGKVDLVFANYGSNSLTIRMGNGDGTFGAAATLANTAPSSLELNDYNNDGVLDILSIYVGGALFLGNSIDGIAPIIPFSLKTQSDAKQALSVFKNKLNSLTVQRGEIGAQMARVDVATSTLSTMNEIYNAAESRIRDVDLAEESGNLIRLQILQQAASAITGQANQQSALVLKLIR